MKMSLRILIFLSVALWMSVTSTAQTDVVIAIDLSKSMETNDKAGMRFIGADQFLTMFSLYGDNRGGAVSFGNDASVVLPLSSLSFDQAGNYSVTFDKLKSEQWTELGKGLELCKKQLGTTKRIKSVIIISDGIVEGNPDARHMSQEQARTQAERELWGTVIPALKATNIRVYAIGLLGGTNRGEATLQKIATETGGFYEPLTTPDEFPQIYKRMLDDIDQPSGVVKLTNDENSIVLTAADQGVIVLGPKRFSLRAPNNLTYTTNQQTPNTPVKQKYVEYDNHTAILFLGRPDDFAKNKGFWTGKWFVQDLTGEGEATYISNVRFNPDEELPPRREFFLNEFYPIKYEFTTQPDFDTEEMLKKCTAKYIVAPQGPSVATTVSDAISPEGNTFKGEYLLEHEGEYILEIKIYNEGTEWRNSPPQRFHVNKTPLIEMRLNNDEEPTVGYPFTIESKTNNAAFTSNAMDMKGVGKGVMTFNLQYGKDDPITLKGVSAGSDGVYRSQELTYKKSGNLEIKATFNGDLVMQPRDGKSFKLYPVKALAVTKMRVKKSWSTWWTYLWAYFLTPLAILSSLITVYGAIFRRRPKLLTLDRAMLIGKGSISLKPEDSSVWKRLSRLFRRRAAVSIGGPASGADIEDSRLAKGGEQTVVELGLNSQGRYYIVRKGDLKVFLNKSLLAPNDPQTISPKDEVLIPDITDTPFRFSD